MRNINFLLIIGIALLLRAEAPVGTPPDSTPPVIVDLGACSGLFSDAAPFSEGLAAVSDKGGKGWGYIDKTGSIVVPFQHSQALSFHEGAAVVGLSKGFGFIDRAGRRLFDGQYELAREFSEGLAAVRIGGKWGYISKKGEFVIAPQFEEASPFSEKLAAVKAGGHFGFIDRTGKQVVTPQFDHACPFSEGLAAIHARDRMGYIKNTGDLAIAPDFGIPQTADVCGFREGLASVMRSGRPVYIDPRGKVKIEPDASFVSPFSEGVAIVGVGSKCNADRDLYYLPDGKGFSFSNFHVLEEPRWLHWKGCSFGLIDAGGNVLVSPKFDEVSWPFSDGVVAVRSEGKFGYVDKNGRVVIAAQFEAAQPFSEGLAAVKIGGVWTYIDKAGKCISGAAWQNTVPAASAGASEQQQVVAVTVLTKASAEVRRLTGIPEGMYVRETTGPSGELLAVDYNGRLYTFATVNGKLVGRDISGISRLEKDIYWGRDVNIPRGTYCRATCEFGAGREKDGTVTLGDIIEVEFNGVRYGLSRSKGDNKWAVQTVEGLEKLEKDVFDGAAIKVRRGTFVYMKDEVTPEGNRDIKSRVVLYQGAASNIEDVGDKYVVTAPRSSQPSPPKRNP